MNKEAILKKANYWTSSVFNKNTQDEVKKMIAEDNDQLIESFYKNLEFGTGGMRGIMGAGTNKINKYTLGKATQGLANYIKKQFPNQDNSVAIGYDCRHNSKEFSKIVGDVLTANGIKVFLFSDLRPTPELSFAVRYLNCTAGIVLTASHNPPEYNGYKVYWNDGSQIVPPHDISIIKEVNNVEVGGIQFSGNDTLLNYIDTEIDQAFQDKCAQEGVFTKTDKSKVNIVFTSIHGTSITAVPQTLKKAGFTNVHIVKEQAEPNGDFPTVVSPNPEEPEALKMALDLAEKVNGDMVIGTDPDADRIGIAIRNLKGNLQLLNGNQTNTLFIHFLLNQYKEKGKLLGKEFIGSTIVSSDIFYKLAKAFNVEIAVTLTGFKWIGETIRKNQGNKTFIGGGEESFGFLVGDFVRDKDSVSSAVLAAEIAAYCKAQNKTMFDYLLDIYTEFGLYQEKLISLTKKGISGAEDIKQMMIDFRANPPKEIAGSPIVKIKDYQSGIIHNLETDSKSNIDIPTSNVLIFYTTDGTKLACRPSGTEPKIKFYISVNTPLKNISEYENTKEILEQKIKEITKQLNLN